MGGTINILSCVSTINVPSRFPAPAVNMAAADHPGIGRNLVILLSCSKKEVQIRLDNAVVGAALKFILYFVELVLDRKLEGQIEGEVLRNINARVFEYNERQGLADFRLHEWFRERWPDWKEEEEDIPEEFPGTDHCPECRQAYLVIGYHEKPVCFYCNTTINAANCEECGETFLMPHGCGCGHHKGEDHGRVPVLMIFLARRKRRPARPHLPSESRSR